MTALSKMVSDIIKDGKVDAQEVAQLRAALYADGAIDREEAEALFQINNAVSGNDNDASWKAFFVEAIAQHVLSDLQSPGVIDDEEATWLVTAVDGDGVLDETEKALLTHLKLKATSISPILKVKLEACGI